MLVNTIIIQENINNAHLSLCTKQQ